ncbi:RagB/SusD family nutrient uptake outer membrane protein [Sphingobacterium sp. SGG-5]|uniref:RagB/SusD family nutrient uptake outer membrane protein n=1 Tax=Sphingobacterium sp. SGG-5 TaxID=2710881 RepID=UPI0013ECCB64|nr:RagB/SusD family nutrient uptake outer membrane protein [Sphingobacterium sp. SGG-5]NGM63163.1 RagB/SusD family nutrient uptake outer membrane protein [Sphingobacterium sp. SGG-5]
MKIKLTLLWCIAFTCFGCSDWLDIDSKVIITDEDIKNYPELAEAQFLSNYAELRKTVHSIGDGAMTYRQHHLESFTDDGASNIDWEAGVMRNNSPGLVFGGIFSQSSGESFTAVWNYKQINIVNKFIHAYSNSTDERILHMVGEALFIRAYLYFEMVKRYGGVPLFAGPLDGVSAINKRATEEESWRFIQNSVDSAILLLPDTQPIIAEDKDRANKYTALALKSRAMLYAGTIAKYGSVLNNNLQGIPQSSAKEFLLEAAEAADQIINHSNNKYKLSAAFGDLFNGKDEDNNEIIFRFSNTAKSGTQVFIDYWNQSYRMKKAGYTAFMVPALDIVEQFETLDGTIVPLEYGVAKNNMEDFFTNRDKRLAASIIYPGGEFLGERFSIYKKTVVKEAGGATKEYFYNNQQEWADAGKVPGHEQYMKSGFDGIFFNNSGAGTTNFGFFLKKTLYGVKRQEDYLNHENDQDAVVLRYGEVVLNFAEAAIELADLGEPQYMMSAQVEFDQLRATHGGLPPKTLTITSVRHERRIDLLYEGFRYWDLKRWRIGTQMHNSTLKALHPVLNIDETVSPVQVFYTLEMADAPALATRVKWFEERDYYSPIPTSQNPGITQNIGWE